MVTGAWSVIYYGRPRASHDIDFVVELKPENTSEILSLLKKLPSEFQYQESAIKQAIDEKSVFNVIYLPEYLKLDFWLLTDEPFDKMRFSRKVMVKVLEQEMSFSTAEDTILQKLKWYKISPIEKSLIDAVFVYQIQFKNLDQEYLKKWANVLGVTKLLKKLSNININEYI